LKKMGNFMKEVQGSLGYVPEKKITQEEINKVTKAVGESLVKKLTLKIEDA